MLEDIFLLLNKNLLTNPIILKCMLWEWVWQDLSFVSNQLKKVYKVLIRLVSGALSAPFWILWQKLSLFFTVIKLFPKFWVPEAVSLVPKLNSLLQRWRIWHHSPEAINSKPQARYFLKKTLRHIIIKTLGWRKHRLESRLLGEIITSDMQMTPPLWQKVKRNSKASWWKWKWRVKKLA